jgi:hypothetical protein
MAGRNLLRNRLEATIEDFNTIVAAPGAVAHSIKCWFREKSGRWEYGSFDDRADLFVESLGDLFGILASLGLKETDAVNIIREARLVESISAAKQAGLSSNPNFLSKNLLIDQLTGTTEQANRIARGIASGDIRVNFLSDNLFDKAYQHRGGTGNATAFAYGDQIYLRKNSAGVFGEAVHEGTHALDYLAGFKGNIWQWENRAWFYERQFQKATGRPIEFQNVNDMLNYIKQSYSP